MNRIVPDNALAFAGTLSKLPANNNSWILLHSRAWAPQSHRRNATEETLGMNPPPPPQVSQKKSHRGNTPHEPPPHPPPSPPPTPQSHRRHATEETLGSQLGGQGGVEGGGPFLSCPSVTPPPSFSLPPPSATPLPSPSHPCPPSCVLCCELQLWALAVFTS